jgi:hypothetical protein
MAKMSKKDLEDIISRDKPGFSIVERETPPTADADAIDGGDAGSAGDGLDLDELRRRYLGDDAATQATEAGAGAAGDEAPAAEDDTGDDTDDEIVVLTPGGTPADPWAPGPGRKSVVVSGKERRVIAEQG